MAAALFVCAVSDLREYRIPNGVLAAGYLAGLLGAAAPEAGQSGFLWRETAEYLERGALTVLSLLPAYALGVTGAGDVKAAGLIIGWLGWRAGARGLGIGWILGAVLALGKLLLNGGAVRRFLHLHAYIGRIHREKRTERYYVRSRDGFGCVVPLGACFCAGAWVSAALQRGWI